MLSFKVRQASEISRTAGFGAIRTNLIILYHGPYFARECLFPIIFISSYVFEHRQLAIQVALTVPSSAHRFSPVLNTLSFRLFHPCEKN